MSMCIFCGERQKTSFEHVPARCFFPSNLPTTTQRVTAPCCQPCQDKSQVSEALVRNVLISLRETEFHPDIQSELAAKRDRGFDKFPRTLEAMISDMTHVYEICPETSCIQKTPAFNLDRPHFHNFAERLMRAILWEEFKRPFFKGSFDWKVNNPLPPELLIMIKNVGKMREVHEMFQYAVVDQGKRGPSLVLAYFYNGIRMIIKAEIQDSD